MGKKVIKKVLTVRLSVRLVRNSFAAHGSKKKLNIICRIPPVMDNIIVVSAFIRDEDKVLLLKRGKDRAALPGYWELPGGKLRPGSSLDATLKYCVDAETKLQVEPTRPYAVFSYINEDTGKHYVELCYHVLNKGPVSIELSPEHTEYAWADKSKISDFQLYQGLRDAISSGFKHTRKQQLETIVKFPDSIW